MECMTDVAALAECVVPLDEEGRRLVRRYWDQVIREHGSARDWAGRAATGGRS